jgi:hypothetical protein
MVSQKNATVSGRVGGISRSWKFWMAVGGALLLATAGLTIVHQTGSHRASTHASTPQGHHTSTSAGAHDAVGAPATSTPDGLVPPVATFTVYLVESQEAADALVRDLTRFERKFDGVDWATSNEMVLALDSPADRDAARTTLKDLQMQYGSGNVHIHDLRNLPNQ